MRCLTFGLTAVLGLVVAADAVAAGPFRRTWERRRAELYAQLSSDLTRRMTTQVDRAREDLHAAIDTRIDAESARLDGQFATAHERLRQQFDEEARQLEEALASGTRRLDAACADHLARLETLVEDESRSLHEAFAAESRALEDRFAAESRSLENRLAAALRAVRTEADAHVARLDERFDTASQRLATEGATLAARVEADGKALTARVDAECAKIEQRSATAVAEVLTATERRVDAARTSLKVDLERHVDDRMAAHTKTIERLMTDRDQPSATTTGAMPRRNHTTRVAAGLPITGQPTSARLSDVDGRESATPAPVTLPVPPLPPGDPAGD
jgi:hypothetical protein